MLYEVMHSIRNFFIAESRTDYFEIKEGTIDLPFVFEGDLFIIEGSKRNDRKVYTYPATELKDEKFHGTVSLVTPPERLIQIAAEVKAEVEKGKTPEWNAESFGNYSRSGYLGALGKYKDELKNWRKL